MIILAPTPRTSDASFYKGARVRPAEPRYQKKLKRWLIINGMTGIGDSNGSSSLVDTRVSGRNLRCADVLARQTFQCIIPQERHCDKHLSTNFLLITYVYENTYLHRRGMLCTR